MMKKHLILFAAALLALSALTGCVEDIPPVTDVEPVFIETEPVTTAPPEKQLVEIDPFEGLDFKFYHDEDGQLTEKAYKKYFGEPQETEENGETKRIQILSATGAKGLQKCRNLKCSLDIWREVLPAELQEGDTVTYRLLLDDGKVSEAKIPSVLEKEYGIRLKQTKLEVKAHFEEDAVKEIDPFEGGNVHFNLSRDHFEISHNLKEKLADLGKKLDTPEFDVTLSLVEGEDLDYLAFGDKVKYTLKLAADGREYQGEEINQYLAANWKRAHFSQTEKEFVVKPDEQENANAQNVNAALKRPEGWRQIAADPPKFSKADLRHIDGSTATIPITAELIRQFVKPEDADIQYYVNHNTTGPAYENLILGKAKKTILFATEHSEAERKLAADNNVELDIAPIAQDGFVFITHKDNPVDSLTVWQIQAIYSGQITNWSQVGGKDEAIVAYQREADSGSQTVMENMVMKGLEMTKAPEETIVHGMDELVNTVAKYQNETCSIGYSFYYYIKNLYQNPDIKVLKINGVTPENENLLNKSYPFTSAYYAVTRKGGDQKAEEIKQYLLSDEGQEIVKLAGYCPVK